MKEERLALVTSRRRPAAILLLDDTHEGEPERRVLEETGFMVRRAATDAAALQAIEATTPDLVIVGWDLSGFDGRTLFARLSLRQGCLARTPVIFITDQRVTERLCADLAHLRARWVLQRPIVLPALPALVARTLSEADKASPSTSRRMHPRLVETGHSAATLLVEATD